MKDKQEIDFMINTLMCEIKYKMEIDDFKPDKSYYKMSGFLDGLLWVNTNEKDNSDYLFWCIVLILVFLFIILPWTAILYNGYYGY